MERFNFLNNFVFKICISLLLFSLNFDSILADEPIICAAINCGHGKCVASSSILGYDCECNEGWKEMQLGPFPTSCMLPNCTLNFKCGGCSPPSFTGFPPLNFTSPCNLVWCNNGECVVDGDKHSCQCQEGNENAFDNPEFPCFPRCALAADCKNVELGSQSPPPPPSGEKTQSPPPPKKSGEKTQPSPPPKKSRSNKGANYSRKIQAFIMILLSVILHMWL